MNKPARHGIAAAVCLSLLASFAYPGEPAPPQPRLIPYAPEGAASGVIRNYGFGLGGVLKEWEEAFGKLHPGIRFEDHLPTSDAAIPALVTGVADLGPDGGEATLTETLSFFETYGYPVSHVTVATC